MPTDRTDGDTERREVEIHPAYMWTCDDCGNDNFEYMVIVEMSEDDAREMMERHGGDPDDWRTGMLVSSPDDVECEHCGAKFTTKDSRDGGESWQEKE